ncbi:hypothetical protein GCM10009527_076330 [Actinomadura nitritigenes]|uniref:Lipoprotein n=1 Tax=Actinomadura nitritigenes TaxID=134602 RepID=A0ABS3RE24_9ACTN|nr:hypothetical protein [Actinomadura nitritigenes]MBO2444287.1 hypothetical protein [Actinomadura nitritigenes]
MCVRVLHAVAAMLAAATLTSGCGVRPTGIISAGSMPVANGRSMTMTLYLVAGDKLMPVTRQGLAGHPMLPLVQLRIPVTAQESRRGLHTKVPHTEDVSGYLVQASRVLVASVTGIDIGPGGLKSGGDWSRVALGQLVCTAQAIPGVSRVASLVAGWRS